MKALGKMHNGVMNQIVPRPIVIKVPYADLRAPQMQERLERQLAKVAASESALERFSNYILDFPVVYVVNADDVNKYTGRKEYTVYVGETNNIKARTVQHLRSDPKGRDDWAALARWLKKEPESVSQYVIGNAHFNKSLTLDIENKLMHYLLGSVAVEHLNNRRANPQGSYYTQDEFDRIFSQIWLELHHQDPTLFPAEEIIRDSALFKASPFHQLSQEQIQAEDNILNAVTVALNTNSKKGASAQLIFVQGVAGTGKTVLLSHLFYRLSTELGMNDEFREDDGLDDMPPHTQKHQKTYASYLLVNHLQQKRVYNQIATKLGLQKKFNQVVKLPAQFFNEFSVRNAYGRGIPDRPDGKADIVLIDEAHLLPTQGNQGYSGKNMLFDVLRRAKVVIAVFDPNQILQSSQQWSQGDLDQLFPNNELLDRSRNHAGELRHSGEINLGGTRIFINHLKLMHQFRISADEQTIAWMDDFAGGVRIGPIPHDEGEIDDNGRVLREPYEIKVFDSPVELFKAIKQKAEMPAGGIDGHGLSRVVATYDWAYKDKRKNEEDPLGFWNVEMHRDRQGQWHMGLEPDDHDGYRAEAPDEDPNRFCHPWNYQVGSYIKREGHQKLDSEYVWAEEPTSLNEVGSTFSIQGFDLNYVGVIIGPSVQYRDSQLVFSLEDSKNSRATNMRAGFEDYDPRVNLRNELNVLLKRGVHGLYLFAIDQGLQKALKDAASVSLSASAELLAGR